MLNYKLAAALHGRLQELCINETVLKTPIVFEREGNIDNGFIISIVEAIDADAEALELTAKSMNSIDIRAKDSFAQRRNAMCDAIVSANEAVFDKGSGGGCTIVSAAVKGKQLAITNLGCGAAFLLHGDELKRLTDEHCTFSMIKDEGVKLNTRYIGFEDTTGLNLPVYDDEKLNAGDVILLCSSTVCDALGEDELLSMLQLPNTLTERVNMIKTAVIDANPDANELDFSLTIIEVGREAASIGSFGGKRLPDLHESPWYALALAGVFIAAAVLIIIVSHNMKTNAGNNGGVETPTVTPIITDGIWNPVATPIPGSSIQPGGNTSKVDPNATPAPILSSNPGGNKVAGGNGGGTGNGGGSTSVNPGGGGGTSTNPPIGGGGGGGKPLPKPTTQPPVYTPPVASDTPVPSGKPTPTPSPDVPTDEPETDVPVTDEPETDEPVTDEPMTDEPVTEEPVTDAPTEPPTPEETPEPEEPNPESNPTVKP